MATFMEKEGLLELLMMAESRIARVVEDDDEYNNNQDLKALSKLDKEITEIEYPYLDFNAYKAKIDEIEAPYKKFEEAKVEFEMFLENKGQEVKKAI